MKEVKAYIKELYTLKLYNSCHCLGNYFHEDDWQINIIAETLEELRLKTPHSMIEAHISVDGWCIYYGEYLIYGDYQFQLGEHKEIKLENFMSEIFKSKLYLSLLAERKKKDAEAKRRKDKQEKLRELKELKSDCKRLEKELGVK